MIKSVMVVMGIVDTASNRDEYCSDCRRESFPAGGDGIPPRSTAGQHPPVLPGSGAQLCSSGVRSTGRRAPGKP